MSWNFRVYRTKVRRPKGRSEAVFSIKETYYGGPGAGGHTTHDIAPTGYTLDELRHELTLMLAATYQPVIKEEKS